MKSAMAIKPPETALWPRVIFAALLRDITGGRVFAMAKNKNARQVRRSVSGQTSEIRSQPEKPAVKGQKSEVSLLISDLRSLTSGVKLRFYAVALRFKRCPLTSDRRSLTSKTRANPAKRSRCFFTEPARMCS